MVPLALASYEALRPYSFEGLGWPFALGVGLSVLFLDLRAGVCPSDAARRMSLTLIAFAFMFVLVVVAVLALVNPSWPYGWDGPAAMLVLLSLVTPPAILAAWNRRSRGWRIVTIPMGVVAIPVAAIWFRPIANSLAAWMLGTIEPLPLPESVGPGFLWRFAMPTYSQVCTILVFLLPGLGLVLSWIWDNKPKRFRLGLIFSLGICVTWALQGFETSRFERDGPRHVRLQRWMGRPTVVHYFEGDLEHSRTTYGWRRPFDEGDYIDACARPPYEESIDWNKDGQWDVWTRWVKIDTPPGCGMEYRVDTKGILGEPDWTFVLPMDDDRASEMIAKARMYPASPRPTP